MKQVIASGGNVNQIKQVFRKQRGRYLQEAALAQVELLEGRQLFAGVVRTVTIWSVRRWVRCCWSTSRRSASCRDSTAARAARS